MGQLSRRVARLVTDLRRMSDSARPTQAEINSLTDRLANLLLRALSDEHHPLTAGLVELEQRAELEKAGKFFRDADDAAKRAKKIAPARPDPVRHFFMPHPGAGDPEARRLWRLQLLLQTAAKSPAHKARLADRLLMSAQSMERAAEEAARASSVATWSPIQYTQFLEQAVAAMDFGDPPLLFRLEGEDFIHNSGVTVTLSPKEASFLRLLVEKAGQTVSYDAFREAGIKFPSQTKNRLVDRLNAEDIELVIASGKNAYILPFSEP